MGKNFGETIDELIKLHEEVIIICNRLINILEPLQNLNLTTQSQSAIIIPEGEGKHHKPERTNAHE